MTPDAATRGRRNRANGAEGERRVARYLGTWWPAACRAVRNTAPDPGDVAETHPRLWWSVKNVVAEQYTAWLAEMTVKAEGRIAVLVVRRRGYADPGRWWAWLTLADLAAITSTPLSTEQVAAEHVRMELHVLVALLDAGGFTPTPV